MLVLDLTVGRRILDTHFNLETVFTFFKIALLLTSSINMN